MLQKLFTVLVFVNVTETGYSVVMTVAENRTSQVKMPSVIERCVCKQNIEFMHNRNQFSVEYFHFMRKLLVCNTHYVQLQPGHDKLVGGHFPCHSPPSRSVIVSTQSLPLCLLS